MPAPYDVIIIGSGIGGLACAAILSKEGKNVCLLEQNERFGGCFQSFQRLGIPLDTGIHYLGAMQPGGTLNQYFKYLGILDDLHLRRMDTEAFDEIFLFGQRYPFAQGHELFTERLTEYFPRERQAIEAYVHRLREFGQSIEPSQLAHGRFSSGSLRNFTLPAWDTLKGFTSDERLQQLLASVNFLYSGYRDRATFYHHAIICDSYIQGAYRLVDGSQQVPDALVERIRANGGTVLNNARVTKICLHDGAVSGVEINGGTFIPASKVISSLHPGVTMGILEKTPRVRKAHITSLMAAPNSYGCFSVYLLKKEGSTPYVNRNQHIHTTDNVWIATDEPNAPRPRSFMVAMQPCADNPACARVVSVLSPMFFHEVAQWEHTSPGARGESYLAFKRERTQYILDCVQRYIPDIAENVENIHTTTPLSYRDYTGVPQGAVYGMLKDYRNPLGTIIPVTTRIPNLLYTGQHLNVHGALGVTLTAMLTCAEILGEEYLARRVAQA